MKDDKASSTAFTVLQGIVYVSEHKKLKDITPLAQAEACRYILEQSQEGRKRLKQLESPLFKAAVPFIESIMMPGFTLHYVLRKRFIEDAIRQALAKGATQIVNIGAGFDTLIWRLHTEFPEVTFIEIDHPATSAVKKEALAKKGENLHMIAVDLSEKSVEKVLTDFPAFDATRKTAYICEGVLMYLDASVVSALFEALKNLTGSNTTFVFTAIAPMDTPDSNVGFLLKMQLKFTSEPLQWTHSPHKLGDFVKQQGYVLEEQANDAQLFERYTGKPVSGITLHKGEYQGVAIVS